jgi:hypothetical protein
VGEKVGAKVGEEVGPDVVTPNPTLSEPKMAKATSRVRFILFSAQPQEVQRLILSDSCRLEVF